MAPSLVYTPSLSSTYHRWTFPGAILAKPRFHAPLHHGFSWGCLFCVSDHRVFRILCPSIIGHSAHRHIPHAFGVAINGLVLACVDFVGKLPFFSYISRGCPFASSDMRMACTPHTAITSLPITAPVSSFR
jgi:hypothetical protein